MPRICRRTVTDAVADTRPRSRGRPRKTPLPVVRFAPVRLADAMGTQPDGEVLACVFELRFPDGMILRVARDADFAVIERLLHHLRRRGE